jgi:hypothetical protein
MLTENKRLPPSQERLRELLSYDEDTGVFVWREQRGSVKKGSEAGCVSHHGRSDYLLIGVDGNCWYAHQLAILYVTGVFPFPYVDHIDCNGLNNSFKNLRVCTQTQNNGNSRLSLTSASGMKGVTYHKYKKKWQAQIKYNNAYKYLGLFNTPKEAHAVYVEAAKKAFGVFARVS